MGKAIRQYLEKFYHNVSKMCPNDFRTAFFEDYEEEIKKYPLLYVQMEDKGYEGGYGIELLYGIANDLYYELQGSDEIDDLENNLTECYIHDFWVMIKTRYKTQEQMNEMGIF